MPTAEQKTLRVAVTGAGGLLGSALREVLPKTPDSMEFIGLARGELDVTKAETVRERLEAIRPDAVIHAAAHTGVDACEEEPELAREVNAVGTAHVARVCAEMKCRLIYLSTDYVFDGTSERPYREDDPIAPLGVYGKTKWEGEVAVREEGPENFLIVRTAWVYGIGGRNFVDAILEKGTLGEPLRVVTDQRGSPTYAPDLADALKALLLTEARGVVHVSGGGECSWYEFAREILSSAGQDHLAKPRSARPTSGLFNVGQYGLSQLDGKDPAALARGPSGVPNTARGALGWMTIQ
jgi:dTDP-4-dehydrorhamnose reductase